MRVGVKAEEKADTGARSAGSSKGKERLSTSEPRRCNITTRR